MQFLFYFDNSMLKEVTVILCFINPYLTNGFFHHYQLDESTFIFRGVRSDFYFFLSDFCDEISLGKQNSPRWDAAFCGITSAAMPFAYVPQNDHQA